MPAIKNVNKWERFWRLVATGVSIHKRSIKWRSKIFDEVICDCWTKKYICRDLLKSWNTKSCWCLSKENNIKRLKTHWDTWTRFYWIRWWICNRCNNKNWKRFLDYWWRWIKCEWKTYDEFKKDMYNSYIEHCNKYWEYNTTIDRIDNNWNYCKDNCKWSTRKEQSINRNFCWENKFWVSLDELSKKYWYAKWSIRNIYWKLWKDFNLTIKYLENKNCLYINNISNE